MKVETSSEECGICCKDRELALCMFLAKLYLAWYRSGANKRILTALGAQLHRR